MMPSFHSLRHALLLALMAAPLCGCSAVNTYVHQRFKVGPNYQRPQAATEPQWIDCHDKRLNTAECPDLSRWWKVFNDPTLDTMICNAYQQNLTLKEAGFRILEARALLGIAIGEIFPQQQNLTGAYTRSANSVDPGLFPPRRYFDNWNWRFNLAWELDFWGRFRRAVIAAQDDLDASVADYDQVLVTLLGDVAANYVQVRTLQNQIKIFQANVKIQQDVLDFIEKRYKAGFRVTELDYDQALSNLRQTEAAIPQFEVALRNATNRLCVLMGMPPEDLTKIIGTGKIPEPAGEDVAVGMPAELLRRRPDVRRAERLAAAQSEQIGIATSDFYPAFSINGTLGMNAKNFADLYSKTAFTGSVGPSFNWRLLEYGRILNNVRFQDARFQELVTAYRQAVLVASEEAENGIVRFLRAQERAKLLDDSVEAAERAVKIVILQYEKGAVDFNRYAVIQQSLITQQNSAVTAHGEISQGLIEIYRALGGGWEMRLTGGPDGAGATATPPAAPPEGAPEEVPVPEPAPAVLEGENPVIDPLPPVEAGPKEVPPAEKQGVEDAPADGPEAPMPGKPMEKKATEAKADRKGAKDPSEENTPESTEPGSTEPMKILMPSDDELEPRLTPTKPNRTADSRTQGTKRTPEKAVAITNQQDWRPRVDLSRETRVFVRTRQDGEESDR